MGTNGYDLLAVSPDGRQFIYAGQEGLYLHSMDEYNAKLITGTEANPLFPFFSPDSQWAGSWTQADHKLKKIAINESEDSYPLWIPDDKWIAFNSTFVWIPRSSSGMTAY